MNKNNIETFVASWELNHKIETVKNCFKKEKKNT